MSDAPNIRWYGIKVTAEAGELAGRRALAAGIHLQNRIRESLSVSQPTEGTGSRKRGLDPSQPGEYPKLVTGNLRRNVVAEFDKQANRVRIGTNVPYGRHLELGTTRMARRPWLTLALKQYAGEMRAIMEQGTMPTAPPSGSGAEAGTKGESVKASAKANRKTKQKAGPGRSSPRKAHRQQRKRARQARRRNR